MHNAQTYIKSNFVNETMHHSVVTSSVLNGTLALELDKNLKNDALNYLYSALITYSEAIKGIQHELYSWATVKLYYSAFYSLRSILSTDVVCVFYIGTKGYSIYTRHGECPAKANGTTHKLVMSLFEKKYPSSPFVNQQIDMVDAFQWLMDQRELANYKNGRFLEPDVPIIFERCNVGLQNLISAYINDNTYSYCFDNDHAMLALPLEIIKKACESVKSNITFRFNRSDIIYLKKLLRINGQPVSDFQNLIDGLK